jgi:glutamate synthase domain-containing protein 3
MIPKEIISTLTYFIDHLRTLDTGGKATGSLIDITRTILYELFDQLNEADPSKWVKISKDSSDVIVPAEENQVLLIDATGFSAEGTDPSISLASLLAQAYEKEWRQFILYRVNGQRLISTAVMGRTNTDDIVMDVYGTPGEYFGAFMQGGIIRLHGNSQNFTAMCMHHGRLIVNGNAGKVCGYASKGGQVFILGNIVDRAWTNSVNDSRCQDLRVCVFGSASKYAGESLMGGDFFFGGLFYNYQGKLCLQERPYRGTKLLGGASRGNMLFFDPHDRLDPQQYVHAKLKEIKDADWEFWKGMVEETLELAGVTLIKNGNITSFIADDQSFEIRPINFKLIVPKGGLKGYESH